MPTHNTTWKDVERAIAKRLGGERISNKGLGLHDVKTGAATTDVEAGLFSVEVKHRKALPKWILDALQQTSDNAKDGRIPIVLLHQARMHHDKDTIMLRLQDFERLCELLPQPIEET